MDDSGSASVAALIGFILVFALVFLLLLLATYIVSALALYKLFRRAGLPTPAAAWVPYWNTWLLYELGGQHGAWVLLGLVGFVGAIPIVGPILTVAATVVLFVINIFVVINVNKATGRDSGGWHVFGSLLFPIWMWVVGFSANNHPWNPQYRTGPFFPGSPLQKAQAVPQAGQQPYYGQQPPYAGYPQQPQYPGPQASYGQPQQPYAGYPQQPPAPPAPPVGQAPIYAPPPAAPTAPATPPAPPVSAPQPPAAPQQNTSAAKEGTDDENTGKQ